MERTTVAIVEDDSDLRDVIAAALESDGIATHCFEDGAKALAALPGLTSCVTVVSDIRMPTMSGLALLHAMKVAGIDIPVIIVTGAAQDSLTIEALRLGALDFIKKPFVMTEVLETVRRAMEIGVRRRRLIASAEALVNAGEEKRVALGRQMATDRRVIELLQVTNKIKKIS